MTSPRPDTIESLAEMAAQHVTGQTAEDDDGVLSLWIEDGEAAVDIRHDIGDLLEAARVLDELARVVKAHADLLRRRVRRHEHGPLTGPVPWPR